MKGALFVIRGGFMDCIPGDFARHMIEVNGTEGAAWLRRLPDLIAHCERQWAITVSAPFKPLSYNYVAPVRCHDGAEAVLKIGFPTPELFTEIEALRLYDGRGMVQLLAADREQGAMLLERLWPGVPLVSLEHDQAATSIAAQIMRQFWRPAPPDYLFPTVADWAAGLRELRATFDGSTGPFPGGLVAQAEALFTDLLNFPVSPMLLHGDLHHWNIVSAQRQPWLALDPKGVVGDPAFEVSAWLLNPKVQSSQVQARRIAQLAEELGFARERLWGWGLARAVLAAWWGYESSGHIWEEALACAETLSTLKV